MLVEPKPKTKKKRTCGNCHWRTAGFCSILKDAVNPNHPACRAYREEVS